MVWKVFGWVYSFEINEFLYYERNICWFICVVLENFFVMVNIVYDVVDNFVKFVKYVFNGYFLVY